MKRILITGGAGFIGSNLVSKLLQNGDCHVTCLDNFDPFYDKKIKENNISPFLYNPNFKFIHGDVIDILKLGEQIGSSFDAVVHLAAKAGVRPSIVDPIAYQEANYIGTQNLLEYARQINVPHFVFASSSSVYGLNQNTPWSENDHFLKPISPYAASKLACEGLGHVYSHLFGIRFLALRFFTVYGPGQRPDLAIHKFARMLVKGEPITLYGAGDTRRDYTYIDDIIQGIIGAINYKDSMYECINIGNNHTVTLKSLIENIEVAFDIKSKTIHLPEQEGDVSITYANIDKAKRLLQYQPKWTLQEGLKAFHNWFETYYGKSQVHG